MWPSGPPLGSSPAHRNYEAYGWTLFSAGWL